MDFELTDDKIKLSGALGYSTIDALHEIFNQILGREDAFLTIDVGQIEQVDTAALQLFLALQRDARARGKEVSWQNISESLSQRLRLTGLEPLFEQVLD